MEKQFFTKAIVSIFFFSASLSSSAQAPNIKWQKTIGGAGDEGGDGYRIIKLADGNYLTFGGTTSTDGDFSTLINKGGVDGFLMKIDPNANILWTKTFGGSGDDAFYSVVENGNGSFTAVGSTTSNDRDIDGNHGGNDVWIARFDRNGNLQGDRCYGGSGDDYAYQLIKESGSSFVFCGYTNSNDGDISGNHGDFDSWAVKIDRNGNIKWSKTFGGSGYDDFANVINTEDGKLVFTGSTLSDDGDATGNHGGYDGIVVKLKQNGNKIWSVCHGGSSDEVLNAGVATQDGNVALTGFSASNDGDVSGNNNQGIGNTWTFKIDISSGNIIWQHCSGSSTDFSAGFGMAASSDGGFYVIGATVPNDSFDFPFIDAQAIKLDADGNDLWLKNFGGSDWDESLSAIETSDGNLMVVCGTTSVDGDVTNQHGEGDVWIVKLSADGCNHNHRDANNNLVSNNFSLNNYPNPFSKSTTISFSTEQSQNVSLNIFDLNGRLITTLANTTFEQGQHQIDWNAEEVNSGIYFLQIKSGDIIETKKLFITK